MRVYVFDNDGTLYDDEGAHHQFRVLLQAFLQRRLSLDPGSIPGIRETLQKKYGCYHSTSLLFSKEFGIPLEEIDEATYGAIDLAACDVIEDPELHSHLVSLPGERHLWTNSPRMYGERVIRALGLADVFSSVVGRDEMVPYAKPQPEAFERIIKWLPKDASVTFIDDSQQNLRAAKKYGWTTIWFRGPTSAIDGFEADRIIERLTEL